MSSPEHRISNRVENVVNFFRVSPQLLIPDALAFAASTVVLIFSTGVGAELITLSAFISLTNTLKAKHNLDTYKRIRIKLDENGWDLRLIGSSIDTLCGRNAARTAAIDTGFSKEIDEYYRQIRRPSWFLPPWFS